jgi:hypothetical protein
MEDERTKMKHGQLVCSAHWRLMMKRGTLAAIRCLSELEGFVLKLGAI